MRALLLLFLAGCFGDPTEGPQKKDETAAPKADGDGTLRVVGLRPLTWVAGQDGEQAWTRLTPGSDGSIQLRVTDAAGRYSIASACGAYVTVIHATLEETPGRTLRVAGCAPRTGEPPRINVRGNVLNGLPCGTVGYGTTIIAASCNFSTYTGGVNTPEEGQKYDFLAVSYPEGGGAGRGYIERDFKPSTAPHDIDMTGPLSFAGAAHKITAGAGFRTTVAFQTEGARLIHALSATGEVDYVGVPAERQQPGDRHQVIALSGNAFEAHHFKAPRDMEVGTRPIAAPTATFTKSGARVSATWDVYPDLIGYQLSIGGAEGGTINVSMSFKYLFHTLTRRQNYSFTDYVTLAEYPGLKPEAAASWSFYAYSVVGQTSTMPEILNAPFSARDMRDGLSWRQAGTAGRF